MYSILINNQEIMDIQNIVPMSHYTDYNHQFYCLYLYFFPNTNIQDILDLINNNDLYNGFQVRGCPEMTPDNKNNTIINRLDGTSIEIPTRDIQGYSKFVNLEHNMDMQNNNVWEYCLTIAKPCVEEICQTRLNQLLEENIISNESYNYLMDSFVVTPEEMF